MIIERATSADRINAILNHPAVRPDVADLAAGRIDMTNKIVGTDNVCLVGRYGAFFCFKYFAGSYEVHTQILPEGRGVWAKEFAVAGAHYMFTATDCVEILTRVPEGHVAASVLTRSMGFKLQFTTPPECLFRGKRVPCAIYALTIQDWAMSVSEEAGAEFHEWLNSQVTAGEPHQPDPDHNRIVGISLDMIRAGQVSKGVVWFNRHAAACRHEGVSLLSLDPPRVRFDAGILAFDNGQIRFEPCH
jgi:hypothetical protein